MTHFDAFVLVSPDVEDIPAKVAELIAPYYIGLTVEPYRQYFSEEMINGWIERFGIGTDHRALLDHLKDGLWQAVGLDEKGLYHITTVNPRPMWDNWCYSGGEYMIGKAAWQDCLAKHYAKPGREEPLDCNSSPVLQLPPDLYPAAIITPDGIWHDLIDFGWKAIEGDSASNQLADHQWETLAHELLQKYKDCLAVGIHCHG